MWQSINARKGVIPGARGIDPDLNTAGAAIALGISHCVNKYTDLLARNNAESKVHD